MSGQLPPPEGVGHFSGHKEGAVLTRQLEMVADTDDQVMRVVIC